MLLGALGSSHCSRETPAAPGGLRFKTITEGFCDSPRRRTGFHYTGRKKKLRGGEAVFWSGERSQFAARCQVPAVFLENKGENGASRHMVLHDTGFTGGGDVGAGRRLLGTDPLHSFVWTELSRRMTGKQEFCTSMKRRGNRVKEPKRQTPL